MNVTMKKMVIGGLLLFCLKATAQEPEKEAKPQALAWSGYLEVYYAYDFGKPANNDRPAFLYSHNRHNEVNLNIGYLKGSYTGEKVRANLSFAAGTYMQANYASEPGVLQHVLEANAGFKISRKKNLWIDAGIMGSHIGFESAISKEGYTLTRSMSAENSPYFESGGKLSYTSDNGKWLVSLLVLNGWQRIRRVEGSSLLSSGAQVQWKPNSRLTLNYSNFIGTDQPDTARLMRYFHNVYGIYEMGKWGFIAGFDIGLQQVSKSSSSFNTWYTPTLITRYRFSGKWAAAARVEYYQDRHSVIVSTGTTDPFETAGCSLNLDFVPAPNAVIRLEARTLSSRYAIFLQGADPASRNTAITTSIAITL